LIQFHPLLRDQTFELRFSGKDCVKEISRARTFWLSEGHSDPEGKRVALGGSLDNAIVIDDFRILMKDG